MTDDQFLSELDECSLHPADFDHLGHVRLAWICLQRYPMGQAVERTCDTIRIYATHLGAPDKFHRTVTEALMHLLAQGGAADRTRSFHDFISANDELIAQTRIRLSDHYSAALLSSAEARAAFVAPDRAPLASLPHSVYKPIMPSAIQQNYSDDKDGP